jgi:hypothetical protein
MRRVDHVGKRCAVNRDVKLDNPRDNSREVAR